MTFRTLTLFTAAAAALTAQKQTADFHGMPYEVMGRRVFDQQVKSSPYSAQEVTESTQTLADGTHIKNTSTNQVYRDVEGRVRMERNFGKAGAQSKAVTIVDPVAGTQYQIDAQAKTATKMNFHARSAEPGLTKSGAQPNARPTMPPPGDAGGMKTRGPGGRGPGGADFARNNNQNRVVESLGHQSFEGVDAEGTRVTTTIPAGTIGNEAPIQVVSERWYSADLKVIVMSRHFDPRVGETVYKLSGISRANPDPSLFQVPTDVQVNERGSMKSRRPVQ